LVNQAFWLDGDGDYVNVPHDPALDLGTGDFTVHLWVNFNHTDGEQVLVEKWVQGAEYSTGWTLTKLDESGDDVLRLALDDGLQGEIAIDSGVLPIPIGTWHHFAATRKGDQVTVYMNGLPVAAGTADRNVDSSSSLKFGHRGYPDNRGFYLHGRIDEVRLYAGLALPGQLFRAIYVAGNARQR
jgi:hypothetical protein